MAKQINFISISMLVIFICVLNYSCGDISSVRNSEYKYIKPNYDLVQLKSTADTISFRLEELTYNVIKSFNAFSENSTEYISFFDGRSGSLLIYRLATQDLEKKISIAGLLDKKKLYRTTAFVKNFDSIFITNNSTLYLVDSSGLIKNTFDFLEGGESVVYASFEQTTPPVYKSGRLYTGVRPFVDHNSLKALRKWKVLYEFSFHDKEISLHYNLSDIYKNNYLGYHFLDYGYCYNNRGNFVFSFPADSTIYEENLDDYHTAYFAKSFQHVAPVKPLTKKEASDRDTSFKLYMMQDSYGPIYFDPFHKRYLRVFKPKISEKAFVAKERSRQNWFIILNEQLQIIGESPVPDGALYNSLVFTKDGRMLMRTKPEDEYALHFIRMEYQDQNKEAIQLTKNKQQPVQTKL